VVSGDKMHDARRSPSHALFLVLCLSCLLFGMMGSGIMQHINSYLSDVGYTPAYAASVVVVAMGVATVAKLVMGAVFDRFGSTVSTAVICLFMTAAAILLLFATQPGMPYVFSVFYGIAFSILSIPAPNLTADLFGVGDYGRIYGVVVMFLSGGMSLGSPLAALLFDVSGSYRPAWMLIVALSVAAIFLVFSAASGIRRYRLRQAGKSGNDCQKTA
jgi:MFS family permease